MGLDDVTEGLYSTFGLDLYEADLVNNQIAVGILAYYWNASNCWQKWASGQVVAGPVTMLGPDEPYTPVMKKTCHYEDMWFSFDDVTYFEVSTLVCEIDDR